MSESDIPLRVPPQSIPAELCVLGSMIKSPAAMLEAVGTVKIDWFYRPAHQTLFATLASMAASGAAVDLVTVHQALVDSGKLESCGGQEYLVDVFAGVPDANSIAYYAGILRDKAVKREIISAGTRMIDEGYDSSIPGVEAIGNAAAMVQKVGALKIEGRRVSASEAMDSVIQNAADIRAGLVKPALPTGIAELDSRLTGGGLRPGQLILIAARPSRGKSMLAGDIARNIAHEGGGVLFISGEMSDREIMERQGGAISNVFSSKLASGSWKPEEDELIEGARKEVSKWRMELIDESRRISAIVSEAKRLDCEWDGGLSVVIVDYLGIMTADAGLGNREQEVGSMARQCKQAAADMQIPWIALHQLNRGGAATRPELHHLRDSGQLEEHANTCLFLDWASEEEYSDLWLNGGPWKELMIRIAKQRGGSTCSWDNAIRRKLRGLVTRTEPI